MLPVLPKVSQADPVSSRHVAHAPGAVVGVTADASIEDLRIEPRCIIYFPVTASFIDGLRRTEPGWLDLAQTMTAGRAAWAVLRHVRARGAVRGGAPSDGQ